MVQLEKQKKFNDWLDGIVKAEHKNETFYSQAWKEAQEKDEDGKSFELSGRFTATRRPYLYRIT